MAYTGVEREFDDIVMRISRSDRAAFDELYRRLYPLLVNYAVIRIRKSLSIRLWRWRTM